MLINRLKHMSSRQLKETFDNLSGREIKILLESKDDYDEDDEQEEFGALEFDDLVDILERGEVDIDEQIDAIRSLVKLGDPAVDILTVVLNGSEEEKVRIEAARALGKIGREDMGEEMGVEIADTLVDVIYNDDSVSVAVACVWALIQMDEDITKEPLQGIAGDKSLDKRISRDAKKALNS